MLDDHEAGAANGTPHRKYMQQSAKNTQWIDEHLNDEGPDLLKPSIRAVQHDNLDVHSIQARIAETEATLEPFSDFCKKCQELFYSWPHCPKDWICVRRFTTVSLEATARKGCRFCSFLLQRLVDECDRCPGLDTIRRIEARLAALGRVEHLSLSVCPYVAGLSLPGKPECPDAAGEFEIVPLPEDGDYMSMMLRMEH